MPSNVRFVDYILWKRLPSDYLFSEITRNRAKNRG